MEKAPAEEQMGRSTARQRTEEYSGKEITDETPQEKNSRKKHV